MSECPDPIHLSAYLDGELPPPQAQEVRRHVETCHLCAAQIEIWRHLSQKLRDQPWPAMDRMALREGIRPEQWQYEAAAIHLVGALSAAAALVLLAVGLWVSLEQPSSASSEPAVLWEIAALEPTAVENPETGLAAWIVRDLSKEPQP